MTTTRKQTSSKDRPAGFGTAANRFAPIPVQWPSEQIALGAAAAGLIKGAALPSDPQPKVLRELLRMAGDLGLPMLHLSEPAGGPGHGLGASLLATQASAAAPVWAFFLNAVTETLDAFVLFGSDSTRSQAREIGLGESMAVGPRLCSTAFDEIRATPTTETKHIIDGELPAVPYADLADCLLVPCRTSSGELLLQLVERTAHGLLVHGSKTIAGVRVADVHLRGVVAAATHSVLVPKGGPLLLEHMRCLRGAFSLVGAASCLLSHTFRLLRDGWGGDAFSSGEARGRLSAAIARTEIAKSLSHKAGLAVQQTLPGAGLGAGIEKFADEIRLAGLAAWYALQSSGAIRQLIDSRPRQSETPPADAEQFLVTAGLTFSSDATEAARWVRRHVLPKDNTDTGEHVTERIGFVETPLAVAAHETASMAYAAAREAGQGFIEQVSAELSLLTTMAMELDLEASLCAKSHSEDSIDELSKSSDTARAVQSTGRKILEACLSGDALSSALAGLDFLWSRGPFHPDRANKPLETILAQHADLADEF